MIFGFAATIWYVFCRLNFRLKTRSGRKQYGPKKRLKSNAPLLRGRVFLGRSVFKQKNMYRPCSFFRIRKTFRTCRRFAMITNQNREWIIHLTNNCVCEKFMIFWRKRFFRNKFRRENVHDEMNRRSLWRTAVNRGWGERNVCEMYYFPSRKH